MLEEVHRVLCHHGIYIQITDFPEKSKENILYK
jgi:hypothetical protein